MSCGNPISRALANPISQAEGATAKLGKQLENTVNYIIANPLPIIEAIAISYALGPSGICLLYTSPSPRDS